MCHFYNLQTDITANWSKHF